MLCDLAPLLSVWTLAVLSPGPDVLAIVSTSARVSRRDGMLVGLGCASGTLVWAAASLAGLSVLLARSPFLYQLTRLAGAAFLAYLGVRLLISCFRRHAGRAPGPARDVTGWRAFRLGLLTNLANPKALVFFGALFSIALPPDAPIGLRVAALGLIPTVAVFWFTVVAWFAGWPGIRGRVGRIGRVFEGVAGSLFIAFGVRLTLTR